MSESGSRCIIVGASHAGVSAAFNLRQAGWAGDILVLEQSGSWPHQKPPLSKAFLLGKTTIEKLGFKTEQAYKDNAIDVRLDSDVERIDREKKCVWVGGNAVGYDKLILATGARPIIPPIAGIERANNLFTMRNLQDAEQLKSLVDSYANQQINVVIIGAGYIGLEAAASLITLGARVTVLERESRVLSRVTSPVMSEYVEHYHKNKGVQVCNNKQVTAIDQVENKQVVRCSDNAEFAADIILVGVGVRPNQSLAEDSGLACDNGIVINPLCQTEDDNVLAIGDCARFFHPVYNQSIRLESVQNAADMAKVAANTIIGNTENYHKIPWFWSDQYEMKIQIVGMSSNECEVIVRAELDRQNCLSIWYFLGDELRCVEAINNPKAYMLGMKAIQAQSKVNRSTLEDPNVPLNIGMLAS